MPDSEPIGDAIGRAVADCIDFTYALYHGSANAFTDPCPNPDTCHKRHTHADVEPVPPAVLRVIALDR
jgi:hypothetical protein